MINDLGTEAKEIMGIIIAKNMQTLLKLIFLSYLTTEGDLSLAGRYFDGDDPIIQVSDMLRRTVTFCFFTLK